MDHAEAKRIALIFLERKKLDELERNTLEDQGGVRTTAEVVAVRKIAELAQTDPELDFTHPPQEHAVNANVRAADGATFAAEFPLFLDEIGDPPKIGEVVHVVYDRSDRRRVRLVIQWRGPTGRHGVRWSVPPTCPRCGAPVDQSTAIYEPHPACRSCRAPLPCQPAS